MFVFNSLFVATSSSEVMLFTPTVPATFLLTGYMAFSIYYL